MSNRKRTGLIRELAREAFVGAQLGLSCVLMLLILDAGSIRESLSAARHPVLDMAAIALFFSAFFAAGMATTGFIFIKADREATRSDRRH